MSQGDPFAYCLNTSTVKGHNLSLVDEAEIAAEAGYDGFEPWVRELDAYTADGGSLEDLGKRLRDLGLKVPNLIGFFEWIVDDDQRRSEALDEARRNLKMAQKIGCERLAAPPFGATDASELNLLTAAERYRDLLELAEPFGVVPMVEFWGASHCLSRLGEAMLVATESRHPNACVLADVFHMYKGSGGQEGLRLLGADAVGLLHMNDYPADPPYETIGDADRVYPGDGIAPLGTILSTLHQNGYRGMLSLELFNETYWACDAREVVRTGLEKMRSCVEAALKG
jgi:2-keto-myo-inositol isomerase